MGKRSAVLFGSGFGMFGSIWPRTHSVYIVFSLRHLSKTICGSCLMSQMPARKIIVGTNKRLSKKPKKKSWGIRYH